MKRTILTLLAGTLLSLAASPYATATPASGAAGSVPSSNIHVTLDRQSLDNTVGQGFEVVSTLRNDSDHAERGLVAHLDVLALDRGVYVDPEDWSSKRTVYLEPLGPHAMVEVPWRVQAVNDGHFVVFVSVTTQDGPARLAVSDGLRLSTAAARTIGAGGVLPLAIGVPGFLLALLVLTRARRRLSSKPRRVTHPFVSE